MALLGVVSFSALHTTRLGLLVTRNHGDAIAARYIALAGIERTKALLYQQTKENESSGSPFNDDLFDDPESFQETEFGPGLFRILRSPEEDETRAGPIYGIVDEERRLNINNVATAELQKIRTGRASTRDSEALSARRPVRLPPA